MGKWTKSLSTAVLLSMVMLMAEGVSASTTLADLLTPGTPEQLCSLADSYMATNNTRRCGEALRLYDVILEKFPNWDRIAWVRSRKAEGFLYNRPTPDYDACIAQCDRVIAQFPESAEAAKVKVFRAQARLAQGKAGSLDDLVNATAQSSPLADRLTHNLGRRAVGALYVQYTKRGKAVSAMDSLLQSRTQEGKLDSWMAATAAPILASEWLTEALAMFDMLSADHPEARNEIAYAAAGIGSELAVPERGGSRKTGSDRERMVSLLMTPRQLVPEDTELVALSESRLAIYLSAWEKNYSGAASLLKNVLKDCPNTRLEPELQYRCGAALEMAGRLDEAMGHFRTAAYDYEDSIHSTPSLFMLGVCLMRSQQPTAARIAFQEIFDHRGEIDYRIRAKSKLAECHAMIGDSAKAADEMSQAAALMSDYSVAAPIMPSKAARTVCAQEAQEWAQRAAGYSREAASQTQEAK